MSTMLIKRVRFGKLQFEERYLTIVDFALAFFNVNREQTKPPTRHEVDWHWDEQVMSCYPDREDSMRVFLLEQKLCPAIQQFWEQREDEQSWKEKMDCYKWQNIFYQPRRALSDAERAINKWAVIMTSEATGDIIVPDIRVFPLHRISYSETARKVLAANPQVKLQKHEMEDLWSSLMYSVYDFVVTLWEQKRNELVSDSEYRQIEQEAQIFKKRKSGEISDAPDASDVEVQPAATKIKLAEAVTAHSPTSSSTKATSKPLQQVTTSQETVARPATPLQPPAESVTAPTVTPPTKVSEQRAGVVLPTKRRTPAARAPPQADSRAGTRGTTSNTIAQPPIHSANQRANQPPARTPMTRSDQTPHPLAHLVRRPPSRDRGRRRRRGNGPWQSTAGPRRPVDSDAVLIPIPTRHPRPLPLPPQPRPPATAAPPTDNASAPWQYDPNTGERTGSTKTYTWTAREFNMVRSGVPPWPYDPQTGHKMGITTGWKSRAEFWS